jgi:hypothetical protein
VIDFRHWQHAADQYNAMLFSTQQGVIREAFKNERDAAAMRPLAERLQDLLDTRKKLDEALNDFAKAVGK